MYYFLFLTLKNILSHGICIKNVRRGKSATKKRISTFHQKINQNATATNKKHKSNGCLAKSRRIAVLILGAVSFSSRDL
jgi:hypothetical protein